MVNAKGASKLPGAADLALRVFVGVLINITLRIFCLVAFIIELVRRATGGHDPAVPRPATARVAPLLPAKKAAADNKAAAALVTASAAGELVSDDDAVAEICSDDGGAGDAAAAVAADGSAATTGSSSDSISSSSSSDAGGATATEDEEEGDEEIEVEMAHIAVDAAAGVNSEAWRLVGPYMRRYGTGALHNSTLWNPEFFHAFLPGVGSQPYVIGRAYCRAIVVGIGDPLADPRHWRALTAAFKRAYPHATYAHTGPEFSRLLRDEFKFNVNDMGAETAILVQQYAYGKKTRTIRNAARDARAAGIAVRELFAADLTPEVCDQLRHVTGDWVAKKSVADNMLRVFIRHVDYDALHLDEGVRLFVAEGPVGGAAPAAAAAAAAAPAAAAPAAAAPTVEEQKPEAAAAEAAAAEAAAAEAAGADGAAAPPKRKRGPKPTKGPKAEPPPPVYTGPKQIVGFVLLDPLWRDGEVTGYVTSLNRARRDGHPGALKLLYEEVMAAAKADGKESLTFGMSPFFNLQTQPFFGTLWVEAASRFLFEFGNNLYQFKNLAFSKARYGGTVVGDAYTDPAVTMTHVYGATHTVLVDMGMLDLYVFLMYVGFFGNLNDTLLKLAGLRTSMANTIQTVTGGAGGGGDGDE